MNVILNLIKKNIIFKTIPKMFTSISGISNKSRTISVFPFSTAMNNAVLLVLN